MRKQFWPKSPGDATSMVFVLLIMPSVYMFELTIVLPELYPTTSLVYYLHFIFGTFLMMNIVGNYIYSVLCDTSTRTTIIQQSLSESRIQEGWQFCSACESIAPPRSWHCSTCEICILKRDHHCMFTGCCVGHFNHRYFTMFLLYLFIATTYSFIYNSYFLWGRIHFQFPLSIIKFIFPFAIFAFGFDDSMEQLYLMFYIVCVIGMIFTGVLSVYHVHLILSGSVAHEKSKNITKYNNGWRDNIIQVFGDKWYLTWITPFIKSTLPHDGTNWPPSATWKEDSKNR
ncbi:probable palmitoyltransferase ZDHHC24 [Aphidius gifuensis]|uniref:probable palmitoyltransferase ZDHHC24 n=1 Tax=Aphidius gifuensis TaxID=684658 RepID=UPI001CDB93C9|nr:probable palmitoyltransferase ZDHHC24 [Aphidius gifuensis]